MEPGDRFGRLMAVAPADSGRWVLLCDCGLLTTATPVGLETRIAPLRPDPIEEPALHQEPAPERAVIIRAEDLPLRYALLLAGADMPEDEMPPGMRLAYLLAGARPLTGGSRCPVN